MLLIRRFEEKSAQLYGSGLIAGFCHLYIGQEAIVVGLNHVASPQDSSVTSYRAHGHSIISGKIPPKVVMAELAGKATGSSKGKGGSMHIFSKANGFYGGNGIVGAQIPIGAGLAFAHKYNKDDGISVSYMGDGAVAQGQVAEAFNLAALWKLPAVFVIENNQYSMGTSVARSNANTDFSLRAVPFGMPAEKVDGMNVLDVIEKGKKAFDYVRSGNGPFLLEISTYRYKGHSMSDPAKYRTREEVDKVRNNQDPIDTFEKYILDNNLVSKSDIEIIVNKIKEEIKVAEEFAINSPEPDAKELYTDVLL
jgi:pyruvate dehydrogenase E1 component alpha subunit